MEFEEKMGMSGLSVLIRFFEKGDFTEYNFDNLFYAIENANDLASLIDLVKSYEFSDDTKKLFEIKLLEPLGEKKSKVILHESFRDNKQYSELFSGFKHEQSDEIDFYYSFLKRCTSFDSSKTQETVQTLLRSLVEDRSLSGDLDKIKMRIGTLLHSSDSDIRLGVEEFSEYLINERGVMDIDEGPDNVPVSLVLSDYIIQGVRTDERSDSQKRLCYIENSLSLLEKTTFTAGLKALLRQYRDEPIVDELLMKLVFALSSKDPNSALKQVGKEIYESQKEDKRKLRNIVKDVKEEFRKREGSLAEEVLLTELN